MTETPLVDALQKCSFHPLLMIVSHVLTRSGFGDVQVLDRRQSAQKSRYFGHELQCFTNIGPKTIKVVVKVIRDEVRVRMLDELVGVADRMNADFALIVTPFSVGKSALAHLDHYHRSKLLTIDGTELAALLLKYHIGVRSRGGVDYAYFQALEESSERVISFINQSAV